MIVLSNNWRALDEIYLLGLSYSNIMFCTVEMYRVSLDIDAP